MIKVSVTIDFGLAGKRPFEKVATVSAKSTVLDALTALVPIVAVPKYGMDHFVECCAYERAQCGDVFRPFRLIELIDRIDAGDTALF